MEKVGKNKSNKYYVIYQSREKYIFQITINEKSKKKKYSKKCKPISEIAKHQCQTQ